MWGFLHPAWAGLAVALLLVQAQPQSRTADLRSRFAREADPVRRARLMPQLGEAELQDVQKEIAAGEVSHALEILKDYRDQTEQCQKGMDALGVDVEKHAGGFKQLQISLRESLRRLDEALVSLPADEQKPFLDVRKELDRINRHLIRQLFPRQPGAEEEPQKAKN